MRIKNISSVWDCLIFFSMVMAMVLVLSGSIVLAQKLVDLNAASEKELESLKGVGPATAKKIVAGRPYKKTEDIMKTKGIKQGEFNKIKDLITVE